ncbi:MAG: DUF1844 domain-containing protein [Myxococcales bacterium]|nr:DUF1844 domain-containing protein [Myxococcales bacterium]
MAPESEDAAPEKGQGAAAADEASEAQGDMPPIDFNIFVLSLNTSALIHLGDAPDAEGAMARNLPMARQTIDMLTILEEKTVGNLDGQEERLLSQVLFDLRMRYARKVDRAP